MSEGFKWLVPSSAAQAAQAQYVSHKKEFWESSDWLRGTIDRHAIYFSFHARLLEGSAGSFGMSMIEALNERYAQVLEQGDHHSARRLMYLALGVSEIVSLEPAERKRVEEHWQFVNMQMLRANIPPTAASDLMSLIVWFNPEVSADVMNGLMAAYRS